MAVLSTEQDKKQEGGTDYSALYRPAKPVKMIKKDGTLEDFNVQKVVDAVGKSAYRALTKFTEAEKGFLQVSAVLLHETVEETQEIC